MCVYGFIYVYIIHIYDRLTISHLSIIIYLSAYLPLSLPPSLEKSECTLTVLYIINQILLHSGLSWSSFMHKSQGPGYTCRSLGGSPQAESWQLASPAGGDLNSVTEQMFLHAGTFDDFLSPFYTKESLYHFSFFYVLWLMIDIRTFLKNISPI